MFPNKYGFTSGFWKTLGHTNGILNNLFGQEVRHIISHTPYFLDRQILEDLNTKLRNIVAETLQQKFRTHTNFQFTLGYYQFIRAEQMTQPMAVYFKEFDTNCDEALDFGIQITFSITSNFNENNHAFLTNCR